MMIHTFEVKNKQVVLNGTDTTITVNKSCRIIGIRAAIVIMPYTDISFYARSHF